MGAFGAESLDAAAGIYEQNLAIFNAFDLDLLFCARRDGQRGEAL